MPQPYDYSLNIPNPTEKLLQGLQVGNVISQMGEQSLAKERALQNVEKQKRIIADLFDNPNRTASDYERAMLNLPELKDHFKTAWEMHSKEQQKHSLQEVSEVHAALINGKPDVAIGVLERRAEALENSEGLEDQAKAVRAQIEAIKINPDIALVNTGMMLGSVPGGKEVLESLGKVGEEYRKIKSSPGELLKQAQDLKLSKANTNKVLSETRKLDNESRKIALELEAMKKAGGVDPDKKFDQEEKLRKEYTKRTQVYNDLRMTYQNLKSSAEAKTGPGDIALVTSFMKMLDPTSVVRETEFATARNTAGLFDRLINQAEALQSGRLFSLDSNQRKEYIDLSKQYFNAAEAKAKNERASLNNVVKTYNLDPDNVFGVEPTAEPEVESVNVNGTTYQRPPNFTDEQWAGYKRAMGVP